MSDYIHPDADFQWRRGDELITENRRNSITIYDSFDKEAQNGGTALTHSRLSTLTIDPLEESDEGNYTCFVAGTDVSADVQLDIICMQIHCFNWVMQVATQ